MHVPPQVIITQQFKTLLAGTNVVLTKQCYKTEFHHEIKNNIMIPAIVVRIKID